MGARAAWSQQLSGRVVMVERGELEEAVGTRGKEKVSLGNRRAKRKVVNNQKLEGTEVKSTLGAAAG